jgi:hypothetical protein
MSGFTLGGRHYQTSPVCITSESRSSLMLRMVYSTPSFYLILCALAERLERFAHIAEAFDEVPAR